MGRGHPCGAREDRMSTDCASLLRKAPASKELAASYAGLVGGTLRGLANASIQNERPPRGGLAAPADSSCRR
jgi:hypothetical protein